MLSRTLPDGRVITVSDKERTPCEIWVRVMGYYRFTENFNIGKRQEHHDRKFFTEASAQKSALFDEKPA